MGVTSGPTAAGARQRASLSGAGSPLPPSRCPEGTRADGRERPTFRSVFISSLTNTLTVRPAQNRTSRGPASAAGSLGTPAETLPCSAESRLSCPHPVSPIPAGASSSWSPARASDQPLAFLSNETQSSLLSSSQKSQTPDTKMKKYLV